MSGQILSRIGNAERIVAGLKGRARCLHDRAVHGLPLGFHEWKLPTFRFRIFAARGERRGASDCK